MTCEDSLSAFHLIVSLPIERPAVALRRRGAIVLPRSPGDVLWKNVLAVCAAARLPSHQVAVRSGGPVPAGRGGAAGPCGCPGNWRGLSAESQP